mgnify:CR=1 FL=1
MLRIIIALLVTFNLTAGAVYFFSKDRVIAEVIAAAQARNATALSARIDWEGLRVFLKEDISKMKRTLGSKGGNVGPSLSQVDAVVDYYAQPENLGLLYHYRDLLFPKLPEEAFIDSIGFFPPYGFYIVLAYPAAGGPALGDMGALMKDRLKARVVFRLDGLTWKVSELHLPIFLVPRQSFSVPAIEYFGRGVHFDKYWPEEAEE